MEPVMSDLRTRLEDMADFCEGAAGDRRPHPNNVAKLCRDILQREERRTEIVDDIREHIRELEQCRGAAVYAGNVADTLKGIADQLDGKDEV
jgi:hypothetical protein